MVRRELRKAFPHLKKFCSKSFWALSCFRGSAVQEIMALWRVFLGIRFSLFATFFIIFLIFSNPAGGVKVLGPEENVSVDMVIDDDLYIVGGDVIIQGTVLGDVWAFGGRVDISGNVSGDVVAGAGTVIIDGNVGDDVRVGAGALVLNGHVGDDLLAGTGNIMVSNNADIGGDAVYWIFGSGEMELRGDVGGNVYGGGEHVTLAGIVGGDVDLEVENLDVLPTARINGNLTYLSPQEASIPSGTVCKELNFTKEELTKEEKDVGASLLWWLVRYLFLLTIGLLVLRLLPNQTAAVAETISISPLANLVLGLMIVVVGLSVPILLFVTVIGIPIGLLLLLVTIIVLYAARLYFGIWLGGLISSCVFKKSRQWLDLVLGLFILSIFASIPRIGFLIYLLVTFVSIGSLFSEQRKFYTEMRKKGLL